MAGSASQYQVWGKMKVRRGANKQTRREWQAEVDT